MACKYGHSHQHVRQETNETCSTACIEMVCKRRGANLEYNGFQTNFYNSFKARDKPGLTHEQISSILRGLGIQSTAFSERSSEKVGNILRENELPIIAEVLYSSKKTDRLGAHWVVVDARKLNRLSADEFCILDPSQDEVICTSIPKTGLAGYQLSAELVLLFSGRMVQVGT